MDKILKWFSAIGIVVITSYLIGEAVSKQPFSVTPEVIGATANAALASHLSQTPTPVAFRDVYANGNLEVDGTLYTDGAITAVGDITAGRINQGGSVAALSVVTSTLTAANICDNSFLTLTPVTTTPTLTLPSTTTLFADCLAANGKFVDINIQAITTSSILAAGTGGTFINSSALTVAAAKGAVIRIIRTSATTYIAFLINLVN